MEKEKLKIIIFLGIIFILKQIWKKRKGEDMNSYYMVYDPLTPKRFDKKMMKYMQKKYAAAEDIFTFVTGDSGGGEYVLRMDSEKFPGETVVLTYYFKEKKIMDNYMGFIFREGVEKAYQEIFDQVYGAGNYRIKNKVPGLLLGDKEYGLDTTLDEYLDTVDLNSFDLICTGDANQKEKKIEELIELLKKKGWGIHLRIGYIDPQKVEDFKNIEIYTVFAQKMYQWLSFLDVFNKKNESVIHEWQKGKG